MEIPNGFQEVDYYEDHGIKIPAITNGRLLPELWALPRLIHPKDAYAEITKEAPK